MWYNNYIDIPYKDGGRDRAGLDCWGLVRLVYSDQYGIELPSFSTAYSTVKDTARTGELIAQHKEQWEPLTQPEPGCVVLMRVLGSETHVGVYIGEDKFLHIRSGANSVVESISSAKWQHRIVGYFKYTEKVAELVSVTTKPHPLRSEKITIPVLAGTKLDFLGDWIKREYEVSDDLISKSIFVVNGITIPPEQWSTTALRETDSVEYRVLARDDNMFRLFAVIAIALIAPQLAGAALQASAVSAAAAGTTLTMAGAALTYYGTYAAVLLVGSALINAIAPIRPPAGPADPGTTTAQNIITGANNQGAPYASIPVVLGKMRVTPPLGAYNNVHTRANPNFRADDSAAVLTAGVAGADTFVDMLLIWGYGPVVVDAATLRVGQVSVYKDDGSINYQGFDIVTLDWQTEPSAALKQHFDDIYGSDISQSFPNVQLTYSTLSDGTTKAQPPVADNPWTPAPRPTGEGPNDPAWVSHGFSQPSSEISVAIQFPQGLRATIVQGDSAGQNRAAPVGFHLQWAKIIPGQPSDWQDWGYYTVGGTVAASTGNDYVYGWGCWYEGQGDNLQQVCGDTILSGSSYTQNQILGGGPLKDAFTWTVTLSRTSLVGGVVQELWNTNDLIQVRVRRTTGDNTEPNGDYRYSHTAVLQSFTSKNTNTKPVVDPNGTKIARSALQIQATDQINGQIDSINAVVQSICPDWDTTTQTWITRPTSNPASLYRYVLQHPANARPVLDTQLDLVQLQHWHEYCDQTRNVVYKDSAGNEFTLSTTLQYNNILGNSPRGVLEVLRDICAAGRASPAMVDGKWSVVIDEPKATIVQHFTPHNSWGFEATKMLPKMPEGLKVQFNDRDNDYVQKEVLVTYADKSPNSVTFLESIQLPGVTSTAEAIDHARWHLAQIKLRPEVYTINTDLEYIVCNRGDRVKVTHDVPLWGGGSGRIKNTLVNNNVCYGVELDEAVFIDGSAATVPNYVIRVRSSTTGASKEIAVATSFSIATIACVSGVTTIRFASPHALKVGYPVKVSVPSIAEYTNLFTSVKSLVYNVNGLPIGVTFDSPGLPDLPEQFVTSGTVYLTSSYYSSLLFATSFASNEIAGSDLFLFGEYGKESQDLIITKIEPTSNKTARLTLVDYGVTSEFNIFTQYNEIASDTTYIPNITQRPREYRYNIDDAIPFIDQPNVLSDERVMRRLSDGTFQYVIRVPFKHVREDGVTPIILSNDITGVQAQAIPANTADTSGATIFSQSVTTGSIDIQDVTDGLEDLSATPTTEGVYRFRLRYISKEGKVGRWSDWVLHKVVGKRNPPADVTYPDGGYRVEPGKLLLSWNANTEPDFSHYEVRSFDAGWGNSEYLFRGNVTELSVIPTGIGVTDTWYIKAVDTIGNYSTNAATISFTYPAVVNIQDIVEEYSDTSLTEATVTLSWSPVVTEFGVKTYEVSYTDTSGQRNTPPTPDKLVTKYTNSTSITVPANWIYGQDFTVKVVDVFDQTSSGFTKHLIKLLPNPVSELRVQVIDNSVLLYWTFGTKTSLPIAHALIKKSTDGGQTWEVIGTKNGEFTSFSELIAGNYTYSVVVVDTDGWESTGVQKTVFVSQPPDYVFHGEYDSRFENYTIDTSTVTVSKVNCVNYAGELLLGVNTTETWQEHFDNNSWTSPQAQVSAGYPYYIQPGRLVSEYTEEIDLGNVLSSSQLVLNITGSNLVGTSNLTYQIYTKEAEADPYIATTGFATNIRYIKIVLTCESTVVGSIYKVTGINLKLSNKQKTESNSAQIVNGDIINFDTEFVDVQSVILTPAGTSPIVAVYDFKDYTSQGSYSMNNGTCTISDLTNPHGLVVGQKVRLYFTVGDAPDGVYTVTEVLGEYSYRVYIANATSLVDTWHQQEELQPSSLAAGDNFGTSVAISEDGNTLVSAGPFQDSIGGISNAGSVYIFTRTGNTWSEQAHLFASNPGVNEYFGYSVAINANGNTIAVGCHGDTTSGGTGAGSVYVFTRSGSTWTEEANLTALDGLASDAFGISVALSSDGNTLAVGASQDDNIKGTDAGSVYVFTRSGTTWTPEATLVASDGQGGDRFGYSTSLNSTGDILAVGAYGADISGNSNVGKAYIFTRTLGVWTEQSVLAASDGAASDTFGFSLSLNAAGDILAVGAYGADISGVYNAGAAYIFTSSGGTWTEQTKLYASDFGGDNDQFGYRIALSGDGNTLAVGALLEDTSAGLSAGAVYVFSRSGLTWSETAKITSIDGGAGDRFGNAVALSQAGATLAVGAYNDDLTGTAVTDNRGSCYIYTFGGNVTTYANSLVCHLLNPQNGQPVTTPTTVSYQIKGY